MKQETNPPAWQLEAAKEIYHAQSISMGCYESEEAERAALERGYRKFVAIIAKHAPQPDATSVPEAHLHTVAGYCEQVWNPTPDGAKPSIDGVAPSKWQRITAENPPQFPCWLWNKYAQRREHMSNAFMLREALSWGYFDYWHPDQKEAPAGLPEEKP